MIAVKKNKHTSKIADIVSRIPISHRIVIAVIAIIIIGYGLIFMIPKQVVYSYGADNCIRQLTLLPRLMKQPTGSGFHVSFEDMAAVGDVPIISLKTCFTPTAPPKPGDSIVRVSPFGANIGVKHYRIGVPEAITARSDDFVGKTLPHTRPVLIRLSDSDQVYAYKLVVDQKSTMCRATDDRLSCDIASLGLEQDKQYDTQLDRYFSNKKVTTVASGTFQTLKALALIKSSVAMGQTIYDKPAAFTFEYDKSISKASAVIQQQNGDTFADIPSKTSLNGSTITVTPTDPLQRNTIFRIILKSAEASDGSVLAGESITDFMMSGGPKVTSISTGPVSAPLSGVITITFDQEITNTAAIAKLVTVQGLTATVVKSGATLRISYADAPKCGNYSIIIAKGFESAAGVVQTDEYRFAGRTQCYSLRSIGTSKNGRSILAYVFGSGAKTILYTGAIHGNEQSSRLLMAAWVNEIEVNPQNIPVGTQLVVIPSVNPDGVAANTRTNAGNVDLNRNFNVSDWKTDIQTVNGKPFPGGGGATPESEPETRALVAYSRSLAPSLTMSYHAAAAYVVANTCGNSGSLASTYANMVGYRNMTGVAGAFSYEITGTYDDWLCEKLGARSVLVELTTNSVSEFNRHKAALWLMARS